MARVTTQKEATSALKKPVKLRAPRKPKDPNAPKVVRKPAVKKPTADEERRDRQREKENAASSKKASALITILGMEAFIQRPPPVYMTPQQLTQKKNLLEEKAELQAQVKEAEDRLKVLMDPIMILKNEIGGYKSRLNYLGVELRSYFRLKEPGVEAPVEDGLVKIPQEEAAKEIDSLFEGEVVEGGATPKEEDELTASQSVENNIGEATLEPAAKEDTELVIVALVGGDIREPTQQLIINEEEDLFVAQT